MSARLTCVGAGKKNVYKIIGENVATPAQGPVLDIRPTIYAN